MWPRVITFDCYGTLVRWPETLAAVFAALLPPHADVVAFHADFNEFHRRLKAEPYRPYSDVLRGALEAAMKKWVISNVPLAQERLLNEVRAIPPYPDVLRALRLICRKFELAIISNTDDDLISNTVRGLEVPLRVITAQQARAYKPDHRIFLYAQKALSVSAVDMLHVGAGFASDMAPAFELGITRIWINRRGAKADRSMPPSAELADLSGLEATVEKLAAGRR